MGALEAADAIRTGKVSSEDLVHACLERIAQFDEEIAAWAHLDRELALVQARQTDEIRRRGKPTGPLHGVPVGIKDIIDTFDLPTDRTGPMRVNLRVFDLKGRLVRVLMEETIGTDRHSVVWDGKNDRGSAAPSGLYIARLEAGGRTQARTMTLAK